jgi:hypothetical protein
MPRSARSLNVSSLACHGASISPPCPSPCRGRRAQTRANPRTKRPSRSPQRIWHRPCSPKPHLATWAGPSSISRCRSCSATSTTHARRGAATNRVHRGFVEILRPGVDATGPFACLRALLARVRVACAPRMPVGSVMSAASHGTAHRRVPVEERLRGPLRPPPPRQCVGCARRPRAWRTAPPPQARCRRCSRLQAFDADALLIPWAVTQHTAAHARVRSTHTHTQVRTRRTRSSHACRCALAAACAP